ncbi:MAG: A/G-specific adenine glycosylase [Chthoniobacterales bacterium]|nr:A/G-specific adenine glycosylase [Chthoniobacterales bacterium]
MLQQTQVAAVIPYFDRWLRRFPDLESLARASESDILHAWQGLGYYSRARNLHGTARIILERHSGVVPRRRHALEMLPGIGRYTANAVVTFAFDASVPIVEANTARLFARLLNLRTSIDSNVGRKHLWEFASSLLPQRGAGRHNSALMDLGALVCIAGQPRCSICPIRIYCQAEAPATLPRKAARAPVKLLTEDHYFAPKANTVLLEQARDRWRGMWILPRLLTPPPARRLLYSCEFPFTHHRITLRVCEAPAASALGPGQRAFPLHELGTIPMPSPHRRALNALIRKTIVRGRALIPEVEVPKY